MNDLIKDLKTIDRRMYRIRRAHGLTQEDVAIASGISTRNYAGIERGTTNLRL